MAFAPNRPFNDLPEFAAGFGNRNEGPFFGVALPRARHWRSSASPGISSQTRRC